MRFPGSILLILLLSACSEAPAPDTRDDAQAGQSRTPDRVANVDRAAEAERARAAISAFAAALQSELVQAMQGGGPVAAIEVCHARAPEITRAAEVEQGLLLQRVSLRNRNPDNAPNIWQSLVLHEFEERHARGEDPADLYWSEVVPAGARVVFRYMQAIPTGAVCLKCHGTDLAPEVAAALAERYPDDQATGFREGDLRGAFVVMRLFSP